MTKLLSCLLTAFLLSLSVHCCAQWTTIPSGTANNLTQIVFPDPLHGYIISDRPDTSMPAVVLKTSDGGSTWAQILYKKSASFKGIDFLNADTGVVIGNNSLDTCYRTFDGGASWTRMQMPYMIGNLFHMNSANEWFYVRSQHFGHTLDGGATWIDSTFGNSGLLPITPTDLQFINNTDVIGFGWYGPTVFKSVDKGMRWTILLSTPPASFIQSGCFPTASIGYFVSGLSGYYLVFKTTDGGVNWTKVDSVNGQAPACIRYIDENNLYVVGGNGYIANSTDGGSTWNMETSGTTNNLNKIIILPGKAIAIGANGTILMNNSLPNTSAVKETHSMASVNVYPNPSNDRITIESPVPFDKNVSFELYNCTGNGVTIRTGVRSSDEVDISNLPDGVYFYCIRQGMSIVKQGKLIKL